MSLPAIRFAASLILTAVSFSCFGQQHEVPQNWFNDPFIQVSSAIRACPEPLGPRVTEAERRLQAHHRAEKGTTCYLVGKCEKLNAYLYDPGIAEALAARIRASAWPATSSLWITVQGKVAYIEGCAAQPQRAERELEALARTVPNVEQARAMIFNGRGKAPYATLNPSTK